MQYIYVALRTSKSSDSWYICSDGLKTKLNWESKITEQVFDANHHVFHSHILSSNDCFSAMQLRHIGDLMQEGFSYLNWVESILQLFSWFSLLVLILK